MKIIVTGNPIDGLSFIGPFHDALDVDEVERHVSSSAEWWIADLTEPDRTIDVLELDKTEDNNLDLFAESEGAERTNPFDNAGFKLTRDEHGRVWAYSPRTDTTYDLTNGLVPDDFNQG
jgi:hypothetical protein